MKGTDNFMLIWLKLKKNEENKIRTDFLVQKLLNKKLCPECEKK